MNGMTVIPDDPQKPKDGRSEKSLQVKSYKTQMIKGEQA